MHVFPHRTARRLAAVAIAVGALLVSGCSTSAPEPSPTPESFAGKTLTVWFPGVNQVEIDLVTGPIKEKFEKETGAKLEVTFVDWGDLSPKLNAAFAAGTAPDVFGHGPAAVADFVVNDRLESLDDYVKSLDPADVRDLGAALPGGQVGGVQYLMPLSMLGNLIIYDAADFKAAGLNPDAPPTTWEGVKAAAEKLTVRDTSGKITRSGLLIPSQAIGRQQSFAALLASAGGQQLTNDNQKAAFNSAAGVKALDFYTSLFDGPNAVSADLGANYIAAPAAQQPIVTDAAAMTIQNANAANQIKAAAPNLDLRVMNAVPFQGQSKGFTLGGAGPGLVINADSDNKSLGWAFIKYMLSPEISAQYTQGIGAVPARASAAETDYVKNNPVLKAFVANASNFLPNPNVPGWVQARDKLDKSLEKALNKVIPAQQALDEGAKEVDTVLAASR
jgi:multiple sugar transport system substrate-binding protein